jgi:hypothetical protein
MAGNSFLATGNESASMHPSDGWLWHFRSLLLVDEIKDFILRPAYAMSRRETLAEGTCSSRARFRSLVTLGKDIRNNHDSWLWAEPEGQKDIHGEGKQDACRLEDDALQAVPPRELTRIA